MNIKNGSKNSLLCFEDDSSCNWEQDSVYIPSFWDAPRSMGVSRLTTPVNYHLPNDHRNNDVWAVDNDLQFDDFLFEKLMIDPNPIYSFDTKSSSIKISTAAKSNKNSEINISKEEVKERRFEESKPSNSSKDFSLRNVRENVPCQPIKTKTNSMTDELGTIRNDQNSQAKSRLKRNTTKKYIVSKTAEQIVYNTLWGYLIKFIRENGPQPFRVLETVIHAEYKNIRKLSGHLYTGNVHKAVKGALTANGLFALVHLVDENEQNDLNWNSAINSTNLDAYWRVDEEVAKKFIYEKIKQVLRQQNKWINVSSDSEIRASSNSNSDLDKYKTLLDHLDKLKPEEDAGSDKLLASLDNWEDSESKEQMEGAFLLYSFFRPLLNPSTLTKVNVGLDQLCKSLDALKSQF